MSKRFAIYLSLIVSFVVGTGASFGTACASYPNAGPCDCTPTSLTNCGSPPTCHLDTVNQSTLRVEACGANGFDGSDDTCNWKAAIWCMQHNETTTYKMGTIEGTSDATYRIEDTLTINTTNGGGIDGRNSTLEWHGTYGPVLLSLEDVQGFTVENLHILVPPDGQGGTRLYAAIEYINRPGGLPSSRNIVDHVQIEGNELHKLYYGIMFDSDGTNKIDGDNDQSTIMNTSIFNVTRAAIYILGGQSLQHRFYAVNASAAEGNEGVCADESPVDSLGDQDGTSESYSGEVCGASFVHLDGGSFTSIGGFRALFKNAEYYLKRIFTPVTIIDSNSEWCARLLRTPSGNACFYMPVTVIGGRFATNGIATDGMVVKYMRHGTLQIGGMRFDGDHASPLPVLLFNPPTWCDPVQSTMEVVGVNFMLSGGAGSNTYDPLVLGPSGRLVSYGNTCYAQSGQTATCIGKAAGSLSFGNLAGKTGFLNIPNGQALMARDYANSADVAIASVNTSDEVELADGSHSARVPSNLILGTSAATSGILRVPNNQSLMARTTGSSNVSLAKLNTSNQIEVGDSSHETLVPSSLILGSSASTTGLVRLPNNQSVSARTTSSSDVSLAKLNTSNQVELGDTSHAIYVPSTTSTGGVQIGSGGTRTTQIVCGNVSIDPPSMAKDTAAEVSASATGVAVNDACSCSARADWSDGIILKDCYASSSGTIKFRFYNAGTGTVNAGAQTADYCCFSK